MASIPRTRGIVRQFDALPDTIRAYFVHFPKLAEEFPWEVSIAYLFTYVELAHNMTIYCGVVKLHKVDTGLAWSVVNDLHLTRQGFDEFVETIFGRKSPGRAVASFAAAAKVRDKIIHGKTVSEADKRKAVSEILKYCHAFDNFINGMGGFRPFGSLRGFKGRGQSLDKKTSRWILKGMGLPIS